MPALMPFAIEYVKGIITTVRNAGSTSSIRFHSSSLAPPIINAPLPTTVATVTSATGIPASDKIRGLTSRM